MGIEIIILNPHQFEECVQSLIHDHHVVLADYHESDWKNIGPKSWKDDFERARNRVRKGYEYSIDIQDYASLKEYDFYGAFIQFQHRRVPVGLTMIQRCKDMTIEMVYLIATPFQTSAGEYLIKFIVNICHRSNCDLTLTAGSGTAEFYRRLGFMTREDDSKLRLPCNPPPAPWVWNAVKSEFTLPYLSESA